MDKCRLQMTFKNVENNKVNISVDNPREDLTSEEIKSTMEKIVEKNIFNSTGGDFVGIVSARKITTQTEEIEL